MKKESLTTREERKLKYTEAGILVVLVLALMVFVGVRLSNEEAPGTGTTGAAAEIQESTADIYAATVEDAEPVEGTAEAQPAESGDAEAVTVASEPAEPAAEPEPVTYAAAEKVFFSGDYEEAAALFSRYTDEHGENAWGFYMLGLAEWKSGDNDAAEDAFLGALELKPDHLKSLVNYSRVLLEQQRADEALTRIEMALAVNPGSLDAARVLGRVQHSLGRLEEAAATYRTVLTVDGQDVWALNNLGLVLIEQEQFEAALAPLARASLLREDIACIQNNLGIALERTGHPAAAAEAYARALEADAGHARADVSLARVSALPEDPAAQPVDLAALAAGFMARPEGTFAEADMEVASALESSAPVDDTPETDGSRNR